MSSNYKKACLAMKREPINPIGSCFDSVAHNVMLNSDMPENAYICHGIGVSNVPGQKGLPMAHAWIECELENGMIVAADTTWDLVAPADVYRKKADLGYVRTYSQKEFMVNWQDFDYPGPWDHKILELIETNKRTSKNDKKN